MARVEFDFTEMGAFFARLKKVAQGNFKKDVALFLEELGIEFLQLIQDEIVRRDVVDTRLRCALSTHYLERVLHIS